MSVTFVARSAFRTERARTTREDQAMNRNSKITAAIAAATLAILGWHGRLRGQDKYSLKSPSGIAYSDFKGYKAGR